jgi:NhaP-type Na+/H+ or K+/H+ antiporter
LIAALKAAFVQGRLTEDELGARVDRIYASQTYAELAEVIADIPTALTGARSPRAPWRATKIAWWFEYAVFLPGIVAVLLLPGGPRTTVWTLIILAAVVYLVFWILGVFMMVASRRAKPSAGQPLPPLSWYDREQVICTLKAALAQGRLTEDEYDERVGQASASRTHAELAALTADLPAGLTAARPPTAKDVRTGVLVIIVAASVLGVILLWTPDNMLAFVAALTAVATVIVASPITVGLMVDARHQKRSGGRLPPRPPRSAGG